MEPPVAKKAKHEMEMITMKMEPPVAKKVKHEMEMFGDIRIDNYYWLRDDTRSDPEVLSHLHQENAYADHIMSETKQLEDQIYNEIRGRYQEDYDILQEDDDLSESLDGEHDPHYTYALRVSPNNELEAYAEDTGGNEIYTLYVTEAKSQMPVGEPLVAVTSHFAWAGDNALVYITTDEIFRPDKVWLHKLGTEQSSDSCLYHETDDMFSLALVASESNKFLFVKSVNMMTSFVFYFDIAKPENGLIVLTPRLDGVDTSASHRGDHFFIKRRSDMCFNSEILACPLDNTQATTVVLPHRPSLYIQDMQLFSDHLVVYEREDGLPRITTYGLPPIGEPLGRLQGGRTVDLIDHAYSLGRSKSQFYSRILSFDCSSMNKPDSVYDYDMKSGTLVLRKTDEVFGGFDPADYVTERLRATAGDGTQIPISIVYRKNLVKLDSSDPLLLHGYGSYEMCTDPFFNASRLSLLDRGFVFAIAHIRGGGEMGRPWYENGKLLKKKNTFTDFIACAEYLIEKKYCSKEKLCIDGKSAGGLLIGVVINMRPDLFKAAVVRMPFLDVLTTMLDPTVPLATTELEEWGDPRKEEVYFYMKSYSPVDNIRAQDYPAILVTAGLNDARVMYSDPAKFVAKLRETKTDDNILIFKCELGAGHFQNSERFQAFTYAFIMKALNMVG